MNEDNKTRILRPNVNTQAPADNQSTRVITENSTSNIIGDDQPATRVITAQSSKTSTADIIDEVIELTAGWMVIIEGPGRGCSIEIFTGMNSIGRDSKERISLDFGDSAISRQAHAFIIYDEKQNDFYIQHGGKSNLVRLNDSPVLAPIALKEQDIVEIGNTKLMFIPLCGETFSWDADA